MANDDDVRLRFDVLTKAGHPELNRYWTTRDRAANVWLFRLVSEVLGAIEAGAFRRSSAGLRVPKQVLGVEVNPRPAEVNAMTQTVPRSKSRKVNEYVKAVLALEAVRRKREERYDSTCARSTGGGDELAAQVATRLKALSGGQSAEAKRILAAITETAPATHRVVTRL